MSARPHRVLLRLLLGAALSAGGAVSAAEPEFFGRGQFIDTEEGYNTDFEVRFEVDGRDRASGTILVIDDEEGEHTELPLSGRVSAGQLELRWEEEESVLRLTGAFDFRGGVPRGGGEFRSQDIECIVATTFRGGAEDCPPHIEPARWSAQPGRGAFSASGTAWQPGQDDADEETVADDAADECRFDEDCPDLCNGAILQRRVCNARNNRCENGLADDCAQRFTIAGGLSGARKIPMSCYQVGPRAFCANDQASAEAAGLSAPEREAVEAEYQRLRTLYDARNRKAQTLNEIYQVAARICVDGLLEFSLIQLTGIITSYTGPTGSLAEGLGEATKLALGAVIDGANPELWKDPKYRPKGADYVAQNCVLERQLKSEIPAAFARRDELADEIRALAEDLGRRAPVLAD